jgi:hypothetical protein
MSIHNLLNVLSGTPNTFGLYGKSQVNIVIFEVYKTVCHQGCDGS